MCGICGIISNRPFSSDIVKSMNKALVHRGPDGEGLFEGIGVSLAMRRLSIIDLDMGWQPLFNEDKSIALVLNGEIYNYIELRSELIQKGHKLTTNGDGEVIVHLFEDYGFECLKFLRGMFAFALWDTKRKRLFIARDRMGEKPLYLYSNDTSLLFSSELRSLLSSRIIDLVLDPFSVDLFFHYHFIPEPYSPIKKVRKLEAGHYIVIEQENMQTNEVCYWRMEDSAPVTGNPEEIIREQLDEVSKLVIRADVPVGVALSGGIDSGLIAALSAKHYAGNMQAISIGYNGRPDTDERFTAKKIAEHLGMKFNDVELSTEEFIKNFPDMCCFADDPIADISAYGYYSISRKAKELGIPVILQGQGGDELFWGYKWVRDNYHYVRLKDKLNNKKLFLLPNYLKVVFQGKIQNWTLKQITKGIFSLNEAYHLYSRHRNENPTIFPFYDYFKSFDWDQSFIRDFYGEYIYEDKKSLNPSKIFNIDLPWDNIEVTLTKLISSTYLLENGIAQGDRLSMTNSVELRLPLLDYKFVETVIGLRKNNSDIKLEPKYWLKQAGKEMLPAWLFNQRKRGFEPPVQEWLSGILARYGDNLPTGELVSNGILNKSMAVKLSQGQYASSPIFPSYFNALVLELWYQGIKNSLKN